MPDVNTPPADPAAERQEVLDIFTGLLAAVTGDGSKKRQRGEKPSWKVDQSHEAAIFSHLNKWKHGELKDPDSGVHPLVHAAWRCLAIAYQETERARTEYGEDGTDFPSVTSTVPWDVDPDAIAGTYQ